MRGFRAMQKEIPAQMPHVNYTIHGLTLALLAKLQLFYNLANFRINTLMVILVRRGRLNKPTEKLARKHYFIGPTPIRPAKKRQVS